MKKKLSDHDTEIALLKVTLTNINANLTEIKTSVQNLTRQREEQDKELIRELKDTVRDLRK